MYGSDGSPSRQCPRPGARTAGDRPTADTHRSVASGSGQGTTARERTQSLEMNRSRPFGLRPPSRLGPRSAARPPAPRLSAQRLSRRPSAGARTPASRSQLLMRSYIIHPRTHVVRRGTPPALSTRVSCERFTRRGSLGVHTVHLPLSQHRVSCAVRTRRGRTPSPPPTPSTRPQRRRPRRPPRHLPSSQAPPLGRQRPFIPTPFSPRRRALAFACSQDGHQGDLRRALHPQSARRRAECPDTCPTSYTFHVVHVPRRARSTSSHAARLHSPVNPIRCRPSPRRG